MSGFVDYLRLLLRWRSSPHAPTPAVAPVVVDKASFSTTIVDSAGFVTTIVDAASFKATHVDEVSLP